MMLGILHDTRNIRNNFLDTVDVTKKHRKAVIEVKPLPKPTGPNLRKLRMGAGTWLGKGMASWQTALAKWIEKWEWADEGVNDASKMTWLEMLIAFELDTTTKIPDDQTATTK